MIRKAVIVVLTLLSVAAAVSWPVSYTGRYNLYVRQRPVRRFWNYECWSIILQRGLIRFAYQDDWVNRSVEELRKKPLISISIVPLSSVSLLGFSYERTSTTTPTQTNTNVMVKIPLCQAAVALGAYPTIAFIRGPLRRWRRRKRGECVNCGYNLTGNVTGVCSECGTATR